jgi:hypothetical protein
LPDGHFQYESPYLNLYMYPAELDYEGSRPLGVDVAPHRHINPQLRWPLRRRRHGRQRGQAGVPVAWQPRLRLDAASKRLQASPGRLLAADRIDELARG